MPEAYIVDALRSPTGRRKGGLAHVHGADLGAHVLKQLVERNDIPDNEYDDVIFGCANQAGEDNRNVARMASLLAGLPVDVPGATINRLCASGMDAVGAAARAIRAGDLDLAIAGGVESMTRAPFVMPKAETAFSRGNAVYDTTIGWRFVNKKMKDQYGIDSMPQTADNVAEDYEISREDQDAFALRSQERWAAADKAGIFAEEIAPVTIPQRKGDPITPAGRRIACAPPVAAFSKTARPVEPPSSASAARLRSRRRWEYSSTRNSSVSEMRILLSDPTPNRPPARVKSTPLKIPSPRLDSVIGHSPATAPLSATAKVSSFVICVAWIRHQ